MALLKRMLLRSPLLALVLAVACASADKADRVESESETFTSTCAPIQYAAVRAFQGGDEIEHYLRQSRRILGALGTRLVGMLRAVGVDVCDPGVD